MLSTESFAQVVLPKKPNEIPAKRSLYQDAISTLNTLQTNAEVIAASIDEPLIKRLNALRTKQYLSLLGITDEQVDRLNIVHVAGTKGKGSTCAFTESILRHHGYKTGLFTSPHLVAVRERIRVNGEPISEEVFVHYFWNTMNAIKGKENEYVKESLPSYPMFLLIMGINVFIHEGVEALVLEVGVGGEYDCTNFIREPIVTGITSLGLDHVVILGDTIDQIAWQKSGIFKENVPAFTVEQDNEIAMNVLLERAVEKKCRLTKVPTLPSRHYSIIGCSFQSSSSLPCLTDLDSRHGASVSSTDEDYMHSSMANFVNCQHKTLEGINYTQISKRDDQRHANVNSRHKQVPDSEKKTNIAETATVTSKTTSSQEDSLHIPLGIPGDVQGMNASLAIQLSHTWLKRQREKRCHVDNKSIHSHLNNYKNASQTEKYSCEQSIEGLAIDFRKLPKETLAGLANCQWPGRYQVFPSVGGDPDLTFFMDGAHTKESIQLCAKWFAKTSMDMQHQLEKSSNKQVKVYRMLIFNVTGRRNASDLMLPLVSSDNDLSSTKARGLDFDYVVCSPNRLLREISTTSDQSNFCVDADAEAKKSVNLAFLFKKMYVDSRKEDEATRREPVSEAVSCLKDAMSCIQRKKDNLVKEMQESNPEIQVHVHTLVTGSLLLVGGVLGIIDPQLRSFRYNKKDN